LLTGFLNSLQLVKEKSSKLDRGIYNIMVVLICLFLPIPAPQMIVFRHFDELMPV